MMEIGDIICATATTPGSGAISIIRVSGKGSLEIVGSLVQSKKSIADAPGYTICYGSIVCEAAEGETVAGSTLAEGKAAAGSTVAAEGEFVDDVLVSVFRAPHSYTGEDSVEISCHASAYIVSKIIELLLQAGCRMALPGEFTRRAFLNGKMDLAQAEAVADMISAGSQAAHRVAAQQLKGRYSGGLRSLRDELLQLTALLELELDFSEEEVEFANRDRLKGLLSESIGQVRKLVESFRDGNAIKNGIPVALVGGVNAGKSTLLNALLGEDRAIVSEEAGTTRDTIEEVMTLQGLQFRFIDTAGLRQTGNRVEKIGIERSYKMLEKADVVIGVLDAQSPVKETVKDAVSIISKVGQEQQLILVRNKVDIFDAIDPENFPTKDSSYHIFEIKYPAFGSYEYSPDQLLDAIQCELGENRSGITGNGCGKGIALLDISAKTGEGLEELKAAICSEQKKRLHKCGEGILVTNLRHYQALSDSLGSLTAALSALENNSSCELVAQDLRAALRSLGAIWGDAITPDEVLGAIFEKFCIGK